jgi:hypothetical protein
MLRKTSMFMELQAEVSEEFGLSRGQISHIINATLLKTID